MKQLPEKLSDLLELALQDLALVEANPHFEVDMGSWVDNTFDECAVCLAGAVMVETLNMPTDCMESNSLYGAVADEWNYQRIRAIDCLRGGNVWGALLWVMGEPDSKYVHLNRNVVGYDVDSKVFRKDMEQLVYDLRKEGL